LLSPDYAAAQFLLLDTCSVMPLCLPADDDLETSRTMPASTPRVVVDPSAAEPTGRPGGDTGTVGSQPI